MQKLIIFILDTTNCKFSILSVKIQSKIIKFASNYLLQRLNVRKNISTISKNNKFNSLDKKNFYQWLVGFTDGDGSFSVIYQRGYWSLVFKISQKIYNLRALYYIKNNLGCGSIYIEKKNNIASFIIRDRKILNSILIPICDKYPLLTSKWYNYNILKQVFLILNNNLLSRIKKDNLINKLIINKKIPINYISPAWSVVFNLVSNISQANIVMSKYWLLGFTEAEGSFYLVKKDVNRMVHAFGITQKLDFIVLEAIRLILDIKTSVIKKNTFLYRYN